jgi:rhomboid family GlyGly-CTERM serine protease
MNVESPATGLGGLLKSLNCDRGYGVALLCVCALLAVPELIGEPARRLLSFDREAIGAGEWWRLLSAHFVHIDLEHAVLNSLGLVLMWALFARDYSPWRWAAIYCGSAVAVSLGLWFADPELQWYVGASGALHGVMTAGTIAHLRRRDLDGWILAVFIAGKIAYEQSAGALPLAGTVNTIVDAHLYGAIGGVVLALLLNSRRQPL